MQHRTRLPWTASTEPAEMRDGEHSHASRLPRCKPAQRERRTRRTAAEKCELSRSRNRKGVQPVSTGDRRGHRGALRTIAKGRAMSINVNELRMQAAVLALIKSLRD